MVCLLNLQFQTFDSTDSLTLVGLLESDLNFICFIVKTSKYNYIIERSNTGYWYNGIEHKYFTLPANLSRKVEEMLKTQQGIALLPDLLINKLKSGGFIIPNETNELDVIRVRNEERINQKDYLLIILPTLNCNYKCWYCIQDHIPSRMSLETIESIKKHIEYMVKIEQIKSLQIEWFGGEPFMYFNQIINPLCEYSKQICEEHNIPYLTTATTNGYFLYPPKIGNIKRAGFTRFQITLDGPKQEHDKVKYQTNCESTFIHVLNNIEHILNNSTNIQILLRINYTEENLNYQIVDDVNKIISPKNRCKIQINPKKVWQETIRKERYNNVVTLLDLFEASGYRVNRLDLVWDFIPCYANRKYYNAINFNGDVIKCTACNDLYDKESHGSISDDGSIIWDRSFISKYQAKSFENEECLACKYLPLCMGICPRDYGSTSYCKFNSMDMKIEDALVNYINSMNKVK